MNIRKKLLLTLLIPCVFLALLATENWKALKTQHNSIETIYKERVIPLRDIKLIADAYAVSVIDLVNKANSGLVDAATAKKELESALQTIKTTWQSYKATQLTPEEAALVQETDRLFAPADRQIEQLENFLRGKQGLVTGELNEFDGALYATIDPISDQLQALIELQLRVVTKVYQNSNETLNRSFLLTLLTLALSILVSAFIGWKVISKLLAQLGGEPSDAADIVNSIADGDLTRKIDASTAASGSIIYAMVKMQNQLSGVLSTVRTLAGELNKKSNDLSQNSQNTIEALRIQSQETEQVATAMNEMAATVVEVARNTQDASTATQLADKEVTAGTELVSGSMKSAENLSHEVEQAANVITRLAEDSVEVGKVLEVIRSIAEQTNLLALNAAIEAARAGEQGRGFAVVADEVRTLASRTHSSTQEIQQMIERIQTGVANAVKVMGQSSEESRKTLTYAKETQQALQSIKASVSELTNMNIQVATSAEEQTMVAEEINRNVVSINEITNSSVTRVNEMGKSSDDLLTVAKALNERISYFKLN